MFNIDEYNETKTNRNQGDMQGIMSRVLEYCEALNYSRFSLKCEYRLAKNMIERSGHYLIRTRRTKGYSSNHKSYYECSTKSSF